MAGAMTILDAIDFTRKMAAGVGYQKPLKICLQIMGEGTRKCFESEAEPDGSPWPKRSGASKRARGSTGAAKLLQDSNILHNSVSGGLGGGTGSYRDLTEKRAALGSNLVYAAIHNNGGTITITPKMRRVLHAIGIHVRNSTRTITIPARRFIGHRPENVVKYDRVFADFEAERARTM